MIRIRSVTAVLLLLVGAAEASAASTTEKLASAENDFLAAITVNMTARAAAGAYRPFVGRAGDVEHIIDSLGRLDNRSVFIVGDKGQGKSALMEAVAARMSGAILYKLDLDALAAGAVTGELKKRTGELLRILASRPNTVLCIDDAHALLDIPQLTESFKPVLASGAVRALFATSSDQYLRIKKQNGGLADHAQLVRLKPYVFDDVLDILRANRVRLEAHYQARLSETSMREAVHLAQQYFSSAPWAQRSIEIIEAALRRLKPQDASRDPALLASRERVARLEREANGLRLDLENIAHDSAEGARAQLLLKRATAEMSVATDALTQQELTARAVNPTQANRQATPLLMQEVVGVELGQSAERMARSPYQKMAEFGHEMRAEVLDQESAIDQIELALSRSVTNSIPRTGPVLVALFAGPTGVGKTETAKALARAQFASPDNFTRIDMNEYMERHSTSRLVGAPPGYIGYDEGGVLTNSVLQKPSQVILLDEYEKAHAEVRKIFMSVFDEGRLQDGQGRPVDFTNVIILLSTNIGSEYSFDKRTMDIAAIEAKYGFVLGSLTGLSDLNRDRQIIESLLLARGWSREEINRYSSIISFNPVSPETAARIAKMRLDAVVAHNLATNQRVITYEPDLPVELGRAGWDPAYGARPINRSIYETVGNAIADAVLSGRLAPGEPLHLRVDTDGRGERRMVASAGDAHLSARAMPAMRRVGNLQCVDFSKTHANGALIEGLEGLKIPERFRNVQSGAAEPPRD